MRTVQRISVDDVPARQRLPYLHDFVASQVAGMRFEPPDAGAFSFELLTSRLDDGTVVGGTDYSAVTGIRTKGLLADGRGDYLLSVHDTDYAFESGGRSWTVRAGDVMIVDEGHPFRFSLPGTRSTIVSLARDRIAALAPRIVLDTAHHFDGREADAALVAGYVDLVRRLPIGGRTAQLSSHIHELVARMLAGRAADDGPRGGVAAARLALVKADICRALTDPELSIETVARRQQVTPRYIQQLFAAGGETFSAYLRDRRVDYAITRLQNRQDEDRPIADIAFEAGFGDLSSFNRAFRGRVGLTPRDVRAGALQRRLQ